MNYNTLWQVPNYITGIMHKVMYNDFVQQERELQGSKAFPLPKTYKKKYNISISCNSLLLGDNTFGIDEQKGKDDNLPGDALLEKLEVSWVFCLHQARS